MDIIEILIAWYTLPFDFPPLLVWAWAVQTPVLLTWWRSEFPADEKVLGLPDIGWIPWTAAEEAEMSQCPACGRGGNGVDICLRCLIGI